MNNLYKESSKIFHFAAKTISFVDLIYMVVFYFTSQHPWLSILGVILFPLVNVPAVNLSTKKSKNYIDYTLALTLVTLFFVIWVSGVNSPGWLPAFSLLTAIEIMVLNKQYKIFLQVMVLLITALGNFLIGKDPVIITIINVILIIFVLLLSTIMNYILGINRKIEDAKKEIEIIHKHTEESIEYASLIQGALVPQEADLQTMFQDSFALWCPKDIVGGDIWFFNELRNDDECLLMVIDCTGHGVPGAFVTMLVKAIEQQITTRISHDPEEEVSPAKLMTIFNRTMKKLLKQENVESISNAGFDGAIIYYNKNQKKLKFAGAETPLFYTQNQKIKMIKGSRHSVGYKKSDANYVFKEHIIDTEPGMQFYLTTDGFLDQNGGTKGFPFGKKRFKAILEENQTRSFSQQKEVMLTTLSHYQGTEERNDDITVIGFKI